MIMDILKNKNISDESIIVKFYQLLANIYSIYGKKIILVLLLMSVVALGEGMSMALLLPLLSVLGLGDSGGQGLVQMYVDAVMDKIGVPESVGGILILVLLAFTLQTALFLCQTWWLAVLQRRYGEYWQNRLFAALIKTKLGFLSNNKLGVMTNLITQEAVRVGGAFMVLATSASTVIIAIVYILVSLALSWQITSALVLVAITLFLSIKGVSKRNFIIGRRISLLNGEHMTLLSEFLGGAKLIKATTTEERTIREVNAITEELRVNYTWVTFLPGLSRGVFELISIVGLCAVLVTGHIYLKAPAANMLLILALFVRLLPKFNMLQQNIQILNSYLPAFAEVKSMYEGAMGEKEVSAASDVIHPLPGSMSIEVQSAGYGDCEVLREITLVFPEKGLYGVVGESGAGKSTLVHLLLGLCDLKKGDIKIGGVSVKDTSLSQWRHSIGYVPQETILFHRTVRENISWGKENASLEEIIAAAKKAHAHEFIKDLPNGYDTVIGDQGLRLSGGQRQRLGIARALLNQSRFLLLDEATSALDSASEQGILQTLEELRKELFIIFVAHRLSTVRNADQIIVFDKGRVFEAGRWEELIEKKGVLFQLAKKQHIV